MKNNHQTLFLAWQDNSNSRNWFPVGRLDVDTIHNEYQFGYTNGAKDAAQKGGFEPLYDFPKLNKRYTSKSLFPLFQNRVMTPQRRSFKDYLGYLGLEDHSPDPFEILSIDGGYRVTDNFQVFPMIQKAKDGTFVSRFFLHGWRHTNESAQTRINSLKTGERLYITLELTNPETELAIQIQTEDYHMIGWAPRYFVKDLALAIAGFPGKCDAHVIKVNGVPAPSKQRVLVELKGSLPLDYTPMSSGEFQLIEDSSK